MEQAKMLAKELLGFLENSPSCYHATENLTNLLKKEGYIALLEQENWKIQPGGKYYVTRNGSSVIAFRVPQKVVRTWRYCPRSMPLAARAFMVSYCSEEGMPQAVTYWRKKRSRRA